MEDIPMSLYKTTFHSVLSICALPLPSPQKVQDDLGPCSTRWASNNLVPGKAANSFPWTTWWPKPL